MTQRLNRTEFSQALQGKRIDVAAARADERLRGLDVARADLDRDGTIRSPAELTALVQEVDRFEQPTGSAAPGAALSGEGGAATRAVVYAAALRSLAVFDVAEALAFRDAALATAFGVGAALPLARGAKGDPTLAVQYGLSRLGFALGRVDGQYGGATERAVKAFQAKAGLRQTGAVDQATLAALDRALTTTDLRTPAEQSGDPLRYLSDFAARGLPRLPALRDTARPADWNHPEVQAAYGTFVAAYWETCKANRVESDCKTLSLFFMDQFRRKAGADWGVQLPRPRGLPATEWVISTAARSEGYFRRFEELPSVRPGYEAAQAIARLDPGATMMPGTNLRFPGVDAHMASRAVKVTVPWDPARENGGDEARPELPVDRLAPGDVLTIDHTGDGRVDHMYNVIRVDRDAAGAPRRVVLATGSFDDMKDELGATAPRGLHEVNNYVEEVTVDLDAQGRISDSRVTWASEPEWLVDARYSARSLLMERKPGGTLSIGRWAQPG